MARRSARQRQTQLAFTPLPPSSPARAGQPEAVRDRAAAVTLTMSPRQARKKVSSLPTPSRSSQNKSVVWEPLTMESSPSSRKARKSFMSTNTTSSPRSKKSQNTLQFDVSSESESDASERTPKSRQHQSVVLNNSDSEENVVFSSKKSRTSRPIEIDSDSDIVLASSRKIPHSSSIIHDSDSDDVVARPAKRVFTSSAATVDSDSDVVSTRPTKKRRISPVLEDYDSDIAIGHPAKSRLMSSARSTRLDNRSQEVVPIARLTRRQTKVMNEALDNREDLSAARNVDLDESDDDEPPRSSFRRVIQEQVTPEKEKLTRRDRDDLEEDLEFLESTDTPPSTRRPSKQSAKQKALEALKKRRSKHQGAEKGTASFNGNMNNSEEEEDSNEHDEEDEEGGSDGNFDEYTNIATEDLDQDEDDFVVEDENSMMGAPVELPVQFSRYQTMKAGDLFKFAVEWMVQKKLNPAFETDDEIYRFSFARLDDFVKGLGGSKYQSSVWTPNFSKSLNSRPVLEDHQFTNSGLLHDRCDACNRSGHPATWEVRFTGNCYDRNSLEEDSDDDSDDESPSVPSATTTYYIGKFCMQNARTAHALAHWRFHLNEWVVDFLKEEGYCTPEKIVQRDGWSIKRRRKYANKVVDSMEEAGEIKKLHRDFRNEINTAQLANGARWDNSSP